MANEIKFGYRIGATLTYGAYEPTGFNRTPAGTSLPEVGVTGYFTASDASVVAGDVIVVKENTSVVGFGVYQPEATAIGLTAIATDIDRISAIQEADKTFNPTLGTLTYQTKGTVTPILKKNLLDPDGAAVNSTEDIIATEVDTTP